MNFLLRSSTQINTATADASTGLEAEREYRIERAHSFHGTQFVPGGDVGGGDDSKGAGEFGSIWTRMAVEDPADFPVDEGSILVPYRDLPENWTSAPDMASLNFLDRDFVFPGEQFHILVYVPAEDTASPERITPFNVAAALRAKQNTSGAPSASEGSTSGPVPEGQGNDVNDVKVAENETEEAKAVVTEQSFSSVNKTVEYNGGNSPPRDGLKGRRQMLLESFRRSHFYVRVVGGEDEPQLEKKQTETDVSTQGKSSSRNSKDLNKTVTLGDNPVLMERGRFNPHAAGGLARNAVACTALANGDVVVLLQISMVADCLSKDAVLEVIQFEKYDPPAFTSSEYGQPHRRGGWDPSQGLLQWLLPLDRPSSPPPSAVVNSIHNSPTKLAISGGNSTIFSFSNLRTSSSGQLAPPPPASLAPAPPPTYTPPTYGPKDWDAALQERNAKTEVGSEGLLSFRGAVLEPQRFSAHCGLEGPHVPGKKWKRRVSVVQPIKLDSYFAQCNAQDLICVLVENILPPTGRSADVVIYVDSVNIVCQSAPPGSPPFPVPIACLEVGDDKQLPGLALRVGEQHSFILRPTNPAWKPTAPNGSKSESAGSSGRYEIQPLGGTLLGRSKNGKDVLSALPEGGEYAVIVSCHCSHTESRLHYKHPLQWRPRPPRDLLLSVSLGNAATDFCSNETQPLFKPQVVTVQATNLTSQDMNLTLLAPSSLANSPLSMVSFPGPTADSPITTYSKQKSFKPVPLHDEEKKETTATDRPESPDQYLDLPPVRRMESVIGMSPTVMFRERNVSAADIVADNSPARSHLWLQSTVPLGCVPAHSTTAVKCDILPLTDGIITLDTLHLAANGHGEDALYIPESPLQIYATSSIATGVA
ncbi:hypothetical protein R1sor_007422 [Riccia sorocarpa]|uniref:Uncharacterized protein n=1 Tax=Riccia sorocarpa TaxID=122646 RepID=A0ABD3HSL4_9MARC